MLAYTSFGWNTSTAIWTEVKVRKPHRCALTAAPISKGETAWRPVGNHGYRYHRISQPMMRSLVRDYHAQKGAAA